MSRSEFDNALILTGPTGSGKSRLALTLAERLGAEIVCMDSMTLYRGMDIGTAKPDAADRRRVSHHLLDVLDPWESASVAWWLERAAACCREIEAQGRRILLVGGTPLYLKALLYGLFDGPPADPAVRQRLEAEAATHGREALHARLAAVDPATAARLHPNDLRRMVRALEVFELTGRPISDWQTQWRKEGETKNEKRKTKNEKSSLVPRSSFLVPRSSLPRCLWLDLPRPILFERINRRVEAMIVAGLIEEAQRLQELGRPLSREASQAAGYAEVFAYLDGRVALAEAVNRMQTRTRKLAKRQITWFRHLPPCQPVTEELTFPAWGLTMDNAP